MPAISDAFVLQPSGPSAISVAATNGPANETTPIEIDAPKRSRKSSGSTSAPARNVSTTEAKPAMNTSQLCVRIEIERVAERDAERQLDERDRDADLDRDHAGEQNGAGENRCQ